MHTGAKLSLALLVGLLVVAVLSVRSQPFPRPQSSTGNALLPSVQGIQVIQHDGQTFITWQDLAQGKAGSIYRYSLYRATFPITQSNLASSQLVETGILNNSGQLFGAAPFNQATRTSPAFPMSIVQNGGTALPLWTGLAVYTAQSNGSAYYAVVGTDITSGNNSVVVPGQSATTAPVLESIAPIQPIKIYDSKDRAQYVAQTYITGEQGLPLMIWLHPSQASGGGASAVGDYYLYFGNESMGYQDGLPSVFSVQENRLADGTDRLQLNPRDTIWNPDGLSGFETWWFGYLASPIWATGPTPYTYPFTENRLLWVVNWAIAQYGADPNRVYCSGQSMGGWGTAAFAFRHPEIFAAVFPRLPRFQEPRVPDLINPPDTPVSSAGPFMPDGVTPYFNRMDMIAFVQNNHGDLPFIGWAIGRQDPFAPWSTQVAMVHALEANHYGFAFSWNNGNHSTGSQAMTPILTYYDNNTIYKNQSFPAFSNSSIDSNIGDGDPTDGDLVGGINLGFQWSVTADTSANWVASISNAIATSSMTVDVTPRRVQAFEPAPGETILWTSSAGQSGTVVTDAYGLVTVPAVIINQGQPTTLTLTRTKAK